MKTLVLYTSKTGFTEKYALWIAEKLHGEVYELKKFNPSDFYKYDIVIYGGGLYMVGINGLKKFLKHLSMLKNKKIIVYASGATPLRDETTDEIRNKNFNHSLQQQIKFFYLRGGFDYSRLGLIDKILMALLKIKLQMKNPAKRTADETGMLAAYSGRNDFTKKKYIADLVSYALKDNG